MSFFRGSLSINNSAGTAKISLVSFKSELFSSYIHGYRRILGELKTRGLRTKNTVFVILELIS